MEKDRVLRRKPDDSGNKFPVQTLQTDGLLTISGAAEANPQKVEHIMSTQEPDLAAYFAGVIDNGGYVSLIETRGKPMPSVSFVTYYEGLAEAAMDFFGCGHITEKKVANERINRQGVPIDIRYRWCASWADAVKVAKIIAPHLAYYREIALKVSEPAQA